MNKTYSVIGFVKEMEVPEGSGIYRKTTIERSYYMDILRSTRQMQNSSSVNGELTISNQFSVIADSYLLDNTYAMTYLVYRNSKWKITSVELQYPRIILNVGGLFIGGW